MLTPNHIPDALPYWLALGLSAGFLVVYFAGALVSTLLQTSKGKTVSTFNLSLPPTSSPNELFAISLASAATTLSTVFVLFLIYPSTYGYHLLICPVSFAAGTMLEIKIYRRLADYGYMEGACGSGLIPRFVFAFTECRVAAGIVTLASAMPLLAILVLELRYGVILLKYLIVHATASGAFQQYVVRYGVSSAPVLFMLMLLGYVFVGGFRAVVTSDVWQYRTMKVGLGVTFTALLLAGMSGRLEWKVALAASSSDTVSTGGLVSFYLTVCVINLFSPLSLATSWQRLYAFRACSVDYTQAAHSAVRKVVILWGTTIGIGVLAHALSRAGPAHATAADRFIDVMEFVRQGPFGGVWFPCLVFPLLVVAAFSGMYSSSDTCVSAVLYMLESRTGPGQGAHVSAKPLGARYYLTMIGIFCLSLWMYWLADIGVGNPGNLEAVASAVFGNAVLIAPTIFMMFVIHPNSSMSLGRRRSVVLWSLGTGFVVNWGFYFLMLHHNSIRQWATLVGFAGAAIPVCLMLLEENRYKENQVAGVS
jgi:hypothetical protein